MPRAALARRRAGPDAGARVGAGAAVSDSVSVLGSVVSDAGWNWWPSTRAGGSDGAESVSHEEESCTWCACQWGISLYLHRMSTSPSRTHAYTCTRQHLECVHRSRPTFDSSTCRHATYAQRPERVTCACKRMACARINGSTESHAPSPHGAHYTARLRRQGPLSWVRCLISRRSRWQRRWRRQRRSTSWW